MINNRVFKTAGIASAIMTAAFIASPSLAAGNAKEVFFTPEVNKLIDKDQRTLKIQGYSELIIPKSMHTMGDIKLPKNAQYVVDQLVGANHTAYLCGGVVRDKLAGKTPNDIDICTSAPYSVSRTLFGDKLKTHESNGVAYGYVEFGENREEKEYIDLVTYSGIPESYLGHVGVPEDLTVSLLTDSIERDLTINALYYDPVTKEIHDLHGGLYDFREGIIDTIFEPAVFFKLNPSIPLRIARFTARYDFAMSARVAHEMKKSGEYLVNAKHLDVMKNLNKIFKSKQAEKGWRVLELGNASETLIPSVAKSANKEAYKAELIKIMKEFDKTDFDKIEHFTAFVMAKMLCPRVIELRKTMPQGEAIRQAISEQAESPYEASYGGEELGVYLTQLADAAEEIKDAA